MKKNDAIIELKELLPEDRESFIKDNQWAFKYGATTEFGIRDEHYEEDGEIISRKTIEECLDDEKSVALRIFCNGEIVGGVVLFINSETQNNELELLFVKPEYHSLGIGQRAWFLIESLYPDTRIWQTFTPYFETRNIHFYVNKLGFSIVEYYNKFHKSKGATCESEDNMDGMFRFQKVMKPPMTE